MLRPPGSAGQWLGFGAFWHHAVEHAGGRDLTNSLGEAMRHARAALAESVAASAMNHLVAALAAGFFDLSNDACRRRPIPDACPVGGAPR